MKRKNKARSTPKASTWPAKRHRESVLILGEEFRKAARALPDLAGSAVHEASHAIGARCFARAIKGVSLNGDRFGACLWLLPTAASLVVARQTLILLAMGEEGAAYYESREEATDDRQKMADEARRIHGFIAPQKAVDAELALARRRAARLVRREWPAIVDVASKLLQFHKQVEEVAPRRLEDLDDEPSHTKGSPG